MPRGPRTRTPKSVADKHPAAEQPPQDQVKRLEALLRVADLTWREDLSEEALCKEIANSLPQSWHRPETCCCRITIDGREFRTANFAESCWTQSAAVRVGRAEAGTIEIGYLEGRPEGDEGSFLEEERRLLEAVAEHLGRIVTHRRSQASLRRSDEGFRKAGWIAKLGYWEWVIATNDLVWSDGVFRIYGMDPATDRPNYDLVIETLGPECRERFLDAIRRALEEGAPFEGEYRLVGLDGVERYTHTIGEVLRDGEGRPVSMFGVVQDVSEPHRAAERIRLLADMANKAPAAITIHDFTGRLFYVNDEACRMHGYTRDELLRKNLHDIDVPESEALIEERMQVIREHGTASFDVRHFRMDGSTIPLHVTVTVVDWQGQSMMLSIATDLTERWRAEEALRDKERLLTLTQEIAHVGTWTVDLESGLGLMSDEAYRIFGLTPDFVLTYEAFFGLIHPDDRPAMQVWLGECTAGSHPPELEFRIVRPDGVVRDLVGRGDLFPARDGKPPRLVGSAQDVTEREHAQDALRESEQRYRDLFEHAGDYILVVDGSRDGPPVIVDANQAAFLKHGCTRGELVGQPISFLDPAPEAVLVERKTLAERGIPFEVTHRRRDGSTFIAEAVVRSAVIGGKRLFVSIERDITERKQTEETEEFLLQCGLPGTGEDFFASLARHLAEALQMDYACMDVLDADGRMAETLAFYSMGDLASNIRYALKDTPCGEVVAKGVCCFPQGLRALFPHDAALMERGAESYVGTTLWDSQGRPIGLIALFGRRPIDDPRRAESLLRLVAPRAAGELERRRAEEALRESEFFFRESQRAALVGSYHADFVAGRWRSSEVLDEIFGIGSEYDRTVPGWLELVHPEDREMMARYLTEEVIGKRRRFDKEYRIVRKSDGQVRSVVGQGDTGVDAQGNVVSLRGAIQDITERKRLEAEREQLQAGLFHAQKMDAVGTLAGGIAHDFNNLLTAIIGNVSLLRSDREADFGQAEMLEEIEAASQTAKGLARQLLTFASGGEPVVATEDVRLVVEQAARFATRGLGVKCACESGSAPVLASVDKDQITQVVQNLVLNAAQAMPAGGTVDVVVSSVEIGAEDVPGLSAGRYARIQVRDRGVGIPLEMLGRVFDPYFSTKGQGRGLGLAVSRSIVVKHGGDIRVESTPGTGTEFTIHLPAVEGGIRDADPGPARATVASSGRVLVMDDEPAVAKVLSRMLTRLGAEVEVVADGAAALEAYHAARESGAPFALVITDLTVPGGMGGREMAVRLRAEDPGARIVVSSGYATDPIMSEYEEHGFADVLAKPYRLAEVAALLSRTMRAGPP